MSRPIAVIGWSLFAFLATGNVALALVHQMTVLEFAATVAMGLLALAATGWERG